ncbi:hypothetical protein, partial [Peribacillus loiseleuriae]|uniref:hypothetical protein n=1 Tax=Peribacillus loiseleuriae TaxID=1679170 RepID=UPI003D036122
EMKKLKKLLMVAFITALGFTGIMGVTNDSASALTTENSLWTNQSFYNANVGTIGIENWSNYGQRHIFTTVHNDFKPVTAVVNLEKQINGSWTLIGTRQIALAPNQSASLYFNVGEFEGNYWRSQVKLYSQSTGSLLFNETTKYFIF